MNGIGLDIDDVVLKFRDFIRKIIKQHFNYTISDDKYYNDIKGHQREYISKFISLSLLKDDGNIEIYEDVNNVLKEIFDFTNRSIVFITARNKSSQYVTEKNLKKIPILESIPFQVYYTGYQTKTNLFKMLNIRYFIDDNVENLKSEYLHKGFLINRQWNINSQVNENIIRVSNIIEAYNIIKEIEENKK